MEKYDIIKDISKRTGGDVYLDVVGAVRTGKSMFIKRCIENLVVSNIEYDNGPKMVITPWEEQRK